MMSDDQSVSNADTASATNTTATQPTRPGRRFPWMRLLVVVGSTVACIVGLQSAAPQWDHQNANLFSGLALIVATIAVLVMLGRHQRSHGKLGRYLAIVAAVAILVVSLVKFEGFSGEMIPQLSWRFASSTKHLATTPVDTNSIAAIDTSVAEAVAATESFQFLGNERNGKIPHREFAVPESPSEIQELWRVPVGEAWSSFAVVGDRAVTMEQRDDMECVTCYRLADGELLWLQSHPARNEDSLGGIGPRTTPTIRGDKVYTQGATGWISCLELSTGEVVWTADLMQLAGWNQTASEAVAPWGRASSPLLVDELCVMSFGGPDELPSGINGRSLIALHAATGEVAWTAGQDQLSYASPTLLTLQGTEQIVSVNESTVTGHDKHTGEVLWTYPWPGQSNSGANCSQVIPGGENRFIIGKGYGGGSALVQVNASSGGGYEPETIWSSSRVLKTKFTHALVDGDVVYALSDGTLQAVELATADELWRQTRTSRSGHGQALLAEDTLVVQNESGSVVFVEAAPQNYNELLQLPALTARTWNIPTIAGRHLLVRNDREAVCFWLPERR